MSKAGPPGGLLILPDASKIRTTSAGPHSEIMWNLSMIQYCLINIIILINVVKMQSQISRSKKIMLQYPRHQIKCTVLINASHNLGTTCIVTKTCLPIEM